MRAVTKDVIRLPGAGVQIQDLTPAPLCKALRLEGLGSIEQANKWLGTYLQRHNQRFAVAPREAANLHQLWRGTPQALREICALHHQRQLSAQGACRFEGKVL